MSNYLKKVITLIAFAVIAALFVVVMNFCVPQIAAVPETVNTEHDGDDVVIGEDVTAVRIVDLCDLGKLTKVNYVPDEFVRPDGVVRKMEIVDLTKPYRFAEKGTLIFIVMPPDPYADDFYIQADRLNKYKVSEWWQFTLCLPKIFSASNIYVKSRLMAERGEIENYDFIDFSTSYDKHTDKYSPYTETTYLNLQFYTRRQGIQTGFGSAEIVTIHYQSSGTAYSGISDCPLIGVEKEVKNVKSLSQNLLVSVTILSSVVLAIFVVLSILERTVEFVSAIVWVFGITVMLFSRFLLGATALPLMWTGLTLAASFIVLGGALLAFAGSLNKTPFKWAPAALMAAGAVISFIIPYVSVTAAGVLRVISIAIKAVGAAFLIVFICLHVVRGKGRDFLQTLCSVLIAVAVIASLFLPQVFPAQSNSMFWLCAATTLITFIGVFKVFMDMKKSNAYLTANLHMEVERQTNEIKSIINERDNLLRFVSHDMKKPLSSSVALLETAISREKDEEQIKTLKIIRQNEIRVVSNLSEIGGYAKFNYIAEPSAVVDLRNVCAALCNFHTFDCNANGIKLRNLVDKSYKVYVKKQGLGNAVSNLILNAVEHSGCSEITLSVKPEKKRITLCVADNGKGVDSDLDVFRPYVSENSESDGVGLYICKTIIESMNGTLSYSSENGATVFYIALLKA